MTIYEIPPPFTEHAHSVEQLPGADEFYDIIEAAQPVAGLKDVPRPPASVIALAQRALNGQQVDGKLSHVGMHTFDNPARAKAFAGHMKNAAAFTDPKSSIRVTITGDGLHIRWRVVRARARKVDTAS